MCNERLELIRNLNSRLQEKVNEWLRENCNGTFIEQDPNSDFCYKFKREGNNANLAEDEIQGLLDYFLEHFSKMGIGCAICANQMYMGTSHLLTDSLRHLQNIV